MIKKALVANRGEIAVRIIRTLKEMGIITVAVYSEPDRHSLHVRLADEAVALKGVLSRETYLDLEKIVRAAKQTNSNAIHPGYGFLSENPEFVSLCESSGIIFIGPKAEAISAMGHKTTARKLMIDAEVPVVPGTSEPIASQEEAQRIANKIGFPILIKAKAGGGGKGMRIVKNNENIASSFRQAASEALQSFGDGDVYIEKLLSKPRHIEIQIIGDSFGNIYHLCERECSIQRRHQKVIEETPSVIVDEDMREFMGNLAKRAAKTVGYEGAGTVEFLVDEKRNVYFLEMNTRLQVEHPITESILGLDLVRLQIEVALKKELSLNQESIKPNGHAIECRIYAEDPENNFMPSPGLIKTFFPPLGPFVRVDSGVFEGFKVPIQYDPIIAKLIVWDVTRNQAIERMKRALAEFKIRGIKTNVQFMLDVLSTKAFLSGCYDTNFLDNNWPKIKTQFTKEDLSSDIVIAIAAIANFRRDEFQRSLSDRMHAAKPPSFWRFIPWKTLN